eukprot:g10866.t1
MGEDYVLQHVASLDTCRRGSEPSSRNFPQDPFTLAIHDSRCLRAFLVVLRDTGDDGQQPWITSIKELQMASLLFCAACRDVPTRRLGVSRRIPPHLLSADDNANAAVAACSLKRHSCDSEQPGRSRVPRLRVRAVTWRLPSPAALSRPMFALRDAEEIRFIFDCSYNDGSSSLAHTVWPPRLRVLEFHEFFNQALQKAKLPQSLEAIRFGNAFNQPIEGVKFPASLREAHFGNAFNKPVEDVAWPPGLQALAFGHSFDQPLARMVWPASLRRFVIMQQAPSNHGSSQRFDQPVDTISWPDTLEQLELGAWYPLPTTGTVWPCSLVHLVGANSVDNLDLHKAERVGAAWPSSLQHLAFGGLFDESLRGVMLAPSIKELSLGDFFDRPLQGVEWPPSLEKLTFGVEFDRPLEGVVWPGCR